MCVGEGVESRIRRSGGEGKKERKRERESKCHCAETGILSEYGILLGLANIKHSM